MVNGTWEDTVWCIKEVNKRAPFDSIIHLGDLTDGMICREVNYHYVDIVKKDLLSLDKLAFRRFQKFIIGVKIFEMERKW